MATLENSTETIPCRHCGNPVRPGMIRCRECRGLLVDSTADEFVLAPSVAAYQQRKCARCGSPLEAGIDDCPRCASALLDDLLKGPAEEQAQSAAPSGATGSNSDSTSELRPRDSGNFTAPSPAEWVQLREIPTTPPNSSPSSPATKPTAETAKPSKVSDDDPPGLFGDDDDERPSQAPRREPAARPAAAKPRAAAAKESSSSDSEIETSAACAALLASLATADATLRVEIATALGKLGDKAARAPLERHMVDKDIRVRRAVAEALVLLGHPKGKSLLEIAERKPAAAAIAEAKGSSTPKPKRTGGGMEIDGAMAKKLGIGVVAIGLVAGGIWYFMNGSPPKKKPKPKAGKSKKVSAIPSPFTYVPKQS